MGAADDMVLVAEGAPRSRILDPAAIERKLALNTYNVDASRAGTDPDARCLTFGGVVAREPGVALVGDVLRGDLAGQIVVSAPGRQLVDGHRHT